MVLHTWLHQLRVTRPVCFCFYFFVVYHNMIPICCEKTRVSLKNNVFRTFRKPVWKHLMKKLKHTACLAIH